MPMITIEMFEGRTQDQKRKLVEGITQICQETCDITPESLHIIIRDMNPENWAHAGEIIADRRAKKT